MPALEPTGFTGRVAWLGRVVERGRRLASEPLQEAQATFAGFAGESHAGLTRPADNRVRLQYPKGTEIRNTRQLSIVSAEELALIAAAMGIERFDPAWIGASMVVEGIADFSLLPPSTRIQFASGATVTVDMQNRPCVLPAPEIDRDRPGFGKRFKPAAEGRRGVTAWVEREGAIRLGDGFRLHVPAQPRWPHHPF